LTFSCVCIFIIVFAAFFCACAAISIAAADISPPHTCAHWSPKQRSVCFDTILSPSADAALARDACPVATVQYRTHPERGNIPATAERDKKAPCEAGGPAPRTHLATSAAVHHRPPPPSMRTNEVESHGPCDDLQQYQK
jgi:hypothetical protein